MSFTARPPAELISSSFLSLRYLAVVEGAADSLTLASLGAAGLCAVGGTCAVLLTKASMQKTWKQELVLGERSVNKRLGSILEKAVKGEVEQLAQLMEMQVGPFNNYISQEATDVEGKLADCTKLINENNDMRNNIIDESESIFNFTGGWRSEKKKI